MSYETIAKECEELSYRDKFRLAQLLIQLARKQEEVENPASRKNLKEQTTKEDNGEPTQDITSIQYVMDRLEKSRPGKKKALLNFIKAMYQFQGGISDSDLDKVVSDLVKKKHIKIESNNKVVYL